jgi:pimeloyl-ACP methyl ester carboxylesterase
MPYATMSDGVRLYYEEAGSGTPILFVHEYAGDWRAWEPQMRFFPRRHRCITYSFRGYTPSDVPDDPAKYGQDRVVEDMRDLLKALQIDKAHVVGLSMGGFAVAHFARLYPEHTLSTCICGCGFGAEKHLHAQFAAEATKNADRIRRQGQRTFADQYAVGPSRQRHRQKDPRGYAEFVEQLKSHDAVGAAHTMQEFQGKRPSLYDFEAEWAACTVPALIVAGDEDENVLVPSLWLKRVMGNAGLLILPQVGHTVNLEEPDALNRALSDFIALAEAGKWLPRETRPSATAVFR